MPNAAWPVSGESGLSEDISETAQLAQPAPARRAAPLRKNRRRPDYLLIARQIALLFVAAELLRAAFASPRLAIRGVRVAGSQRVPAARVTALAAVPKGR